MLAMKLKLWLSLRILQLRGVCGGQGIKVTDTYVYLDQATISCCCCCFYVVKALSPFECKVFNEWT